MSGFDVGVEFQWAVEWARDRTVFKITSLGKDAEGNWLKADYASSSGNLIHDGWFHEKYGRFEDRFAIVRPAKNDWDDDIELE